MAVPAIKAERVLAKGFFPAKGRTEDIDLCDELLTLLFSLSHFDSCSVNQEKSLDVTLHPCFEL